MSLNERKEWSSFLVFLLNITTWACLVKSGLKINFHWKSQLHITLRTLRKVAALDGMSLTTEKRDASCEKRLEYGESPFDKSLMCFKDNNSPKNEPWRAPALTFFQNKFCPFRTTRCLRQYRNSYKSFKRLPEIPFKDVHDIDNPSWHTLSKVFNITKKNPLTSSPSSNELYILWVIAINWFTQESPGLNPDWLGEIKLLSAKRWKALYKWGTQKFCCRLEVRKLV